MEEIGLSGSKPVETLVSLNVKLYTDHEELSSSKPQFKILLLICCTMMARCLQGYATIHFRFRKKEITSVKRKKFMIA